MGRPKKFKETARLSIAMSKEQAERIKQAAIRMSYMEGRDITTSEAARMALETIYPIIKQQEFKF